MIKEKMIWKGKPWGTWTDQDIRDCHKKIEQWFNNPTDVDFTPTLTLPQKARLFNELKAEINMMKLPKVDG